MRSQKGLKEKTIKNYIGGFTKIINEVLKMKPEYSDVDELIKNEDLHEIKDKWFSITENKALDERGNSMYSAGFKKLMEFCDSER
mgnify:FL=1